MLLAICALSADDTSSVALEGLAAHDRLAAGGRPYAAYIARLYSGFASARLGLLLPALAHFRACMTLAATELLGENSLSRARACASQILCWLGAPPRVANFTCADRYAEAIGIDSIPPAFEARVDVAYSASLLEDASARASAILEQGAEQARARGWRRVAASLDCSLVDHGTRFGATDGIGLRLECLASEVVALHSSHLQQRVALTGARVRIMQGDLDNARRQLDSVFPAIDTARTVPAVCAAFLRFGLSLARGDSRLSEQAATHLLTLAEQCPCVGLLARDVDLLSRHVATETARRRLAAMIARLDDHSRASVQSATTRVNPPGTRLSALSPRERDVLDLIVSGMSRRETAEFLGISESSVKSYQASVFRKLGVTRRSDAIQEAKRCGLWQS
jgi:DNA-binding CsgD family transcriptional regulator